MTENYPNFACTEEVLVPVRSTSTVKIKIKNFTSYTTETTTREKEWGRKEHQLVIENKYCEKKKNIYILKFEFEFVVLYLYRWEAPPND
jgi:hypothetical protein